MKTSKTCFYFDFFFLICKAISGQLHSLICGTGHKETCNKYTSILHVYLYSHFGEVTGESIKICLIPSEKSQSTKRDTVTKGHQE